MEAIDILLVIFFIILSYLIGSIPFGVLLGKAINKKDIRQYGSNNIGATNALRVLGKKTGALVFVCDMLKGTLIILLVKLLSIINIWHQPQQIDFVVYGFAAIIGHCFPIFIGFKGGKAIATSLGVLLVLSPLSGLAAVILFAILVAITGYVSLGSTAAAFAVITINWILFATGTTANTTFIDYLLAQPSLLRAILYSFVALLIVFKHRKNYIRLLNGTENSFKKKKSEQD